MKKLLLMAVLALGVVACEKNDLGMDMNGSSINAIVETPKLDAKAVLDYFINIAPAQKGSIKNTAKDTGNSIDLAIWDFAGNQTYAAAKYVHVISEDYDACYDTYTPVSLHYDWDVTGNVLTVIYDGTTSEYDIVGTQRDAYTNAFNDAVYFLARVIQSGNQFVVDGIQPAQIPAS